MYIFVTAGPASLWLGSPGLGLITAFDLAATIFLLLCLKLLRIDDPALIKNIANKNDANRTALLVITAIVTVVLLIAVGSETIGRHLSTLTKALIILTLIISWLFSNSVYALHYAHMAYIKPGEGCTGLRFPGTADPVYWDFLYFAFTCGMAFATSDVEVTDQEHSEGRDLPLPSGFRLQHRCARIHREPTCLGLIVRQRQPILTKGAPRSHRGIVANPMLQTWPSLAVLVPDIGQ